MKSTAPLVAPLLLAAGLAAAPRAEATTGLEWKLEGQTVRYFLDAQVHLPEVVWFRAERNDEIRVYRYRVTLVTTCGVVRPIGKKAWELGCSIDDLSISAARVPQDPEGDVLKVLSEWDERLSGASVEVVLTRDGRVRSVDIDGIVTGGTNRRTTQQIEGMTLAVTRAFALLDLQLPKKGDDGGEGSWKQSEAQPMKFASEYGSQGTASILHTLTATTGDVVTIETAGRGTLGTGEMVVVRGQYEEPKNLFDMHMTGEAHFDLARGLLVDRQYVVEGTPTASSVAAENGGGFPYVQAARLRLIEEGAAAPDVGESGDLSIEPDAVDVPTAPVVIEGAAPEEVHEPKVIEGATPEGADDIEGAD